MKKLKTKTWTAERVKALRLSCGLTQAEFATVIGVTQQLIQRIEGGTHKMGRMTEIAWEKIEEHLKRHGCSPAKI